MYHMVNKFNEEKKNMKDLQKMQSLIFHKFSLIHKCSSWSHSFKNAFHTLIGSKRYPITANTTQEISLKLEKTSSKVSVAPIQLNNHETQSFWAILNPRWTRISWENVRLWRKRAETKPISTKMQEISMFLNSIIFSVFSIVIL